MAYDDYHFIRRKEKLRSNKCDGRSNDIRNEATSRRIIICKILNYNFLIDHYHFFGNNKALFLKFIFLTYICYNYYALLNNLSLNLYFVLFVFFVSKKAKDFKFQVRTKFVQKLTNLPIPKHFFLILDKIGRDREER